MSELIENIKWLLYRKMPSIDRNSFVIIMFLFLPYTPILMAIGELSSAMSVAEYTIYTQSAMMVGVIIFIISMLFLWIYGKFYWKRI